VRYVLRDFTINKVKSLNIVSQNLTTLAIHNSFR